MRAVLDTSVIIANLTGLHLFEPGDELAISTITMAELHFGVLVAQPRDRAARLKRLLAVERRFDAPLPVDEAVAESYGELAATVVHAGRQPRRRSMDLLIAATAHAHDARLYTRNPADFIGFEELLDVIPVGDPQDEMALKEAEWRRRNRS